MTKRLRSRLSIKWIMPPLMVLPVVVVAIVLITVDYRMGRRSVNELADANMEQIHRNIEEHLNGLMELPPTLNGVNRRMVEAGGLSLTEMGKNREPLFRELQGFQAMSAMGMGTADGRAMWVIRYPGEAHYEFAIKAEPTGRMKEYALDDGGNVVGQATGDYEFHPEERPWYKAAVETGAAGGGTWGDVYVWVRHGQGATLGVTYTEPVLSKEGKVLGVINTELTLSDISAFLAKQAVGKTGKAFIVDSQGQLIATSVGMACMTADLKRVAAPVAEDKWIAAVGKRLAGQQGSIAGIDRVVPTTMEVEGRAMRVVASPYRNRRNLEWRIVTVAPDSDFLAQVEENRDQSMKIGLATVLMMLLVSIGAVVAMMRPLLKLVEHVRGVGEGRLEGKLALHHSREMAEISEAINGMVEGLSDRVRLHHALDVAMDVQQHLLPTGTPAIEGVEVAAFSKYCDQTGGDYYDYLDVAGVGEKTLVVALGDVMGHGVAAAMLMAAARGMLRSRVRVPGSLGDLLTHVNELLVADTRGMRFMTMLVGVIDVGRGTMRWSSAGHDAPFVYDPATDSFPEVEIPNGLPLGVMCEEPYAESGAVAFRPGQVMVIGTDGIWEAKNDAGEEFGRERLKELLREMAGRSAAEIQTGIFARLTAYCGNCAMEDDVTYVVIKFVEKGVGAREELTAALWGSQA